MAWSLVQDLAPQHGTDQQVRNWNLWLGNRLPLVLSLHHPQAHWGFPAPTPKPYRLDLPWPLPSHEVKEAWPQLPLCCPLAGLRVQRGSLLLPPQLPQNLQPPPPPFWPWFGLPQPCHLLEGSA